MHTFRLYDSEFTHSNPNLSPVHNLRCDLTMCDNSLQLLKERGLVKPEELKKFPSKLHCVLTEIPEIGFSSQWTEGATTQVFKPITEFLNNTTFGKIVQVVAYENYVPVVHTNEFSQQVMKSGGRPQLRLKFTIYTDTYNKRYNFNSSPYETWLRMLYFSTAPLLRATYKNLFDNLKTAVKNVEAHSDDISNTFGTLKDAAAALAGNLPFVEKDPEEAKKLGSAITQLKEVADALIKYVSKASTFGQVCWDISVPNFLYPTNKTPNPVFWNVKTFNVSFSEKFTRGSRGRSYVNYRPRPLYANFEVTLEANQVMTREQYITMLFGGMKTSAIKFTNKDEKKE